ncbi:MAG: sugar transferase [Syntrophobacteraceae bacterium]
MRRDLPSEWDVFGADKKSATDSLTTPTYDEEAFQTTLTLERKRTERSKRPFLLMLLSLERIPAGENGQDLHKDILSCIASSIRDIDVLGWYKTGSILGVIFTEIGDSKPAADCILDRVKTNLASCVSPRELTRIEISFYFFPEAVTHFDSPSDLTLYPDIQHNHSSRRSSIFLKRAIDIIGSLAAIISGLPFFVIIAAAIKLTSKGPVFFRQQRIGQYGKAFTFLKFRSMYVNNDPAIHEEYVKKLICTSDSASGNGCSQKKEVFKIQNDPRITKIGKFIRKTSLDELPQFINVLKGEMSLVGPRPPIPYEFENYDIWHRRRVLDMKPGITGVWQVEGRSRTTFNEMVRLDLYYLTNWSIWLDLKLLFRTPLVVLTSKGAY